MQSVSWLRVKSQAHNLTADGHPSWVTSVVCVFTGLTCPSTGYPLLSTTLWYGIAFFRRHQASLNMSSEYA